MGLKVNALAYLGYRAEGLEIAQELLERSLRQPSLEVQLGAMGRVANLLIELGRMDEARLITERMLDLGQQTGEPTFLAYPHWTQAFYYSCLDSPEALRQALAHIDKCLAALPEGEAQAEWRAGVWGLKATCLAHLGEHADALETIRPLCEYLTTRHRPDQIVNYLWCGVTLQLAGKLDEAQH